MATESSLTRYEYIRKLDATCDLVIASTGSGAKSAAELDVPALLQNAPEYHASLVPDMYPETFEAVMKPKNSGAYFTHFVAVKKYLSDLARKWDEGQPVLYYEGDMSPEIFLGMDLMPLAYEMPALFLAATYVHGVEEEIDAAEAMGMPAHACSAQKPVTAAIAKGMMPKPDILVKTSVPCDSGNMAYQVVKELFGAELIVMDAPYYHNKRAFTYFVDEWKRMIEVMERKTGHTLDEDRLRKHVEMGNRQLEYIYGLQKMRRCVPNPDPGMHRGLDLASVLMAGINEQIIDYNRTCYEEARTRPEEGKSFLPEDKKEIRTLWTWGFTGHMLYLADWLEEEFGMSYLECALTNMPEDLVGYVDTSSMDSMIEGLAWRTLNYPMGRSSMGFADTYINDLVKVAKSYKADVAVFSGHVACKHSWAISKMLSDALLDDAGVPSFKWETDILDARFTPHAAAKQQLSEFFKTLV